MKKISLLLIIVWISHTNAQSNYVPTTENLEARKWFDEAKFGLFIHWGVYSILGDGEWVMNNQNISIEEYEKLPSFFNPIEYNAEEWVKMAKNAGMKYITITSRHHDGFSMFDTKLTDYNIVQKTPYKKDVLKDLAAACKKEGIKLFFYYSLLDWHNDDYFPRGNTGTGIQGRGEGKWENYIAFMKAQLTELLTNYGDIAGIWFDGKWDRKDANWYFDDIYKLIHDIQPQCLIGNNHHESVLPGEDFQMFEKDLPGKSTQGFASKPEDIGELPKEVCETINGSWGFNLKDRKHKSKKELVQYLIKAAGYNSNLLLNVGPMPNGNIQPEHIQSLAEVGDWLKQNGETIYGTEGGLIPPNENWVSTQKGQTLYLHILNTQKNILFVPEFIHRITSIKLYHNKSKIKFEQTKYGLFLDIPLSEQNDIDTIVEITLK
ncbi:alpha-L-fucosidase [Confluentibacter flavum]|uniref:alpha-L-fucosidase n=1 Tax=Confluentibacter flavum TaxID=1909700 RepID=A0A2N3HJW2_9FLAO|nr:alpha-L-fucosidase [Confluentibacter flavum]PKQ45270.1 alpha-L-fucosidase [Confluentibacter flavum]